MARSTGGEVAGVVWAIDGRKSDADRCASPAPFAKRWQKLLRAAATEALMADPVRQPRAEPVAMPSDAEILAWLGAAGVENQPTATADAEASAARPTDAEPSHTAEEVSLPARTPLRRCRGDTAHLVECFDTADATAGPVHVTMLAP